MRFRRAFLIALIVVGVPVIAFEYLTIGMLTIEVISPIFGIGDPSYGQGAAMLLLSICLVALVVAFVIHALARLVSKNS